jgi:tyrosyl-tRNA synthetase
MEFNYMILQAYDFYELFKNNECILQIGGSDQWGNIVNGVDLIRRKLKKEAFGITSPLITLASGAKMGKSESGAVWLDKDLLSPFDYWQFWRNTDDRDVIKFLKMFTDISLEKINEIKDQNINELKTLLANETTKMLHGEEESKKAEDLAKSTFKENSSGENLPSLNINKELLGKSIIDLIEFVSNDLSKSEIRRLIKNNGIKIDNEKVLDEKFIIDNKIFKEKGFIKLSIGKKKHFKIVN